MEVARICFEVGLVIAPHIGYGAQYVEIHRTRSIAGYAPIVSLILLTSNTLRVYYYIGHRFLFALLCQALVGIAVHGALLLKVLEVHLQEVLRNQIADLYNVHSAVVISAAGAEAPTEEAPPTVAFGGAAGKQDPVTGDGDATALSPQAEVSPVEWPTPSGDGFSGLGGMEGTPPSPAPESGLKCVVAKFLRLLFSIEDFLEAHLLRQTPLQFACGYVIAAAFALGVVLLYYISIGRVWKHAADVVGYAALGLESLLVLPQILRNARRRSTEGLTMLLILTWVGGDAIKVAYFIYARQSLPFILCGCFQAFLDVVVVVQLVYYRFIVKRDTEVRLEEEGDANGGYPEGAVPAVAPT
ncbi:hypothetical protein LSCM1_04217 [Leishmania martiniquensis]|uniref:PQ loop repeat family protein n=1 Tax=Leishmania martiniquensis TaxID=1580590 RepID=A0A836GMH6_9TRYP|nr:hypothetical protein LSCM1_04217 [Leishmania martiniquensis]